MLFLINLLHKWLKLLNSSLNGSQMVAFTFAMLILCGSLLLMLPMASGDGSSMRFIDALFTATSTSCVTGLVVVDTGHYFSWFGKLVMIVLIQIGGLGIMTLTTLLSVAVGKRINLRERLFIQESLNLNEPSGVVRLSLNVVKYALTIEFIFGTILAWHFYSALDMGLTGIAWGYWHAISAFCNAGFDLFGDYASLTGHYNDITLNLCIMALITIGGIGFTVLDDLRRNRKWKKLRLHSKIVLTASAILTFGGTLVILALEYTNPATLGGMPNELDKWMAAAFQAVTCRTAGFNTIDLTDMRASSLFFMVLLMGIGASPTSTGGGMKTTTVLVLLVSTWGLLHGKRDTVLFDRRIASETVDKAYNVFTVCLLWMLGAYFLLLICDGGLHRADYVLFEVVSAFATVGLGVGITPDWNDWGKLILVLTMYAGRIGVLTFVLSFLHSKDDKIRYPSENIMIG